MDLHKVHIVNCNQDIEIEDGTSLLELSKDFSDLFESPILVASVNHNLCDLNYKICSNSHIEFLILILIMDLEHIKAAVCLY